MSQDKKLQVGQTVFIKSIGYNHKETRETTITEVKTKYFKVAAEPHILLEKDTLKDKNSGRGWGHNYKIYLSQQEINDEEEQYHKARAIQEFSKRAHSFSLEDIRKIHSLLEEAVNKKNG